MGEVQLYTSRGGLARILKVRDQDKHLLLLDEQGAEVLDLEKHAYRHAAGMDDEIQPGALRFYQLGFELGDRVAVTIQPGDYVNLDAGIYYVFLSSNTVVEVYDGATFRTVLPAGSSGLVISPLTEDVRIRNTGASAETVVLRRFK